MMGNDISKIKIFSDIDAIRLEKTVNEFMEDKFVYDIKHTSLIVTTESGSSVCDRIVVLYEDRYEADDNIMTIEEAYRKLKGEI